MVSPEPGRSSSSPSVKVTELKREGTDGSVLRVHLDDGSLFLFDSFLPVAARLELGLELDESLFSELESAAELFSCQRRALSLLARAEQCRWGLSAKLARKGFSRDAVSSSLDKLESVGLLDDYRFAETWVRYRLQSQPEGPSRLRGALMAKGVSSTVAREAVDAILEEIGDEDSDDALERAWVKLSRRPGISNEKLTAALVRKGFKFSKIRVLLSGKE